MRAFLSHSSANKIFVSNVFSEIGHANAEYDEATFSAGVFNTEAIECSLKRSEIFVLFATPESLKSNYVTHEVRLAIELFARGLIKKILVFCLDGVTPKDLPPSIGVISAVRMSKSPGACARRIKSELIQMDISSNQITRPYMGREDDAKIIKNRLSAPDEKTPVALAFSGFDGIGRRTLASKTLPEVYPGIIPVPPVINVSANDDIRDLHRSLVEISKSMDKSQLLNECKLFEALTHPEQVGVIVGLIEEHYRNSEMIFIVDDGGVLDEGGKITNYIKNILEQLAQRKYARPFIVFILFRTPPGNQREKQDIITYFKVDLLDVSEVRKIVSLHIKSKGQTANQVDINRVVDLTDRHPYNIQYVLRLLDTHSVSTLAQDPTDLIAFKKRQGDEFVSKINLNEMHKVIISLLRLIGQSNIELISSVLTEDASVIAQSLKELEEYHCIERFGHLFSINRPLRAAFERSSQFKLSQDEANKFLAEVLKIYNSYQTEDNISISLISGAAKAAIYLNNNDSDLFRFILPSNQIFVARQLYDLKKFDDCARVCEQALRSQNLITVDARLEAIRLRGLSLARLSEDAAFNALLKLLDGDETSRAREIRHFLEGFQLRLQGNSEAAIAKFKIAHSISPNFFSTLRELSHALMVTGRLDDATKYAEQAYKVAPTNPYVIDQVLALRIVAKPRVTDDIFYDPSISELLDKLEKYGDEEGKSFYAIRMADI